MKHFRFRQAQANGTQTQRRIGRDLHRSFQILIRTQIECANGNRLLVHFDRHGAVRFELFVFSRQIISVQK